MKQKSSSPSLQIHWVQLVPLLIIILTLYVVIPQLHQFETSFTVIRSANIYVLGLGFVSVLLSVFSAAAAYKILSFKPIQYSQIAVVQYASMFINRLLPAGIGGMGLFADFFYRHKHRFGAASAVVAVNNLIGFIGHIILLILFAVFIGITLPSASFPSTESGLLVLLVVLCISVVLSIALRFLHNGVVRRTINNFKSTLWLFRKRKSALLGALVFAIGNTLFHLFALCFVLVSFGGNFDVTLAIVVLSGGILGATISPTPGGLLGSEAGLTAVMLAYGYDAGFSLAVALTYRMLSYWLPIVPGLIAFAYARNRRYV
jgi:uncharacterized protein (TIRG00374 family)